MADPLTEALMLHYYSGYSSPAVENYRADPYNELGTQVSTQDVQSRMPQSNALSGLVRALAGHVPENTEHGLSLVNMLKGGLGSAANWLDRRPEIGPDTLAPLGLAALNPLGKAAGALRSAERIAPVTPAEAKARAAAMGFDTETVYYHGTPHDFGAFDPGAHRVGTGGGDPHMEMSAHGVYMTPSREYAEMYGPNVHEMYVRHGRRTTITDNTRDVDSLTRINDALRKAKASGYDSAILRDVRDEVWPELVVFDPSNIRSIHAQFDPAKRGSASLLSADSPRASLPGTIVNGLDDHDPR